MLIYKIKVFLLLAGLMLVSSCRNVNVPVNENIAADTLVVTDTSVYTGNVLFGIPIDTYNIVNGRIRNNQFISSILASYNVPWEKIEQLLRDNTDTFDPRKVRSGSEYSVFLTKDTLSTADYLIYDHDPFVRYVFSLKDSLTIHRHYAEVRRELKFSSGTIESSLWNATVENNLNPNLAGELSEIYAWTIDFFGLQKGDKFKVIYEEEFIEDRSVGINTIYAAHFEHAGASIFAIPYTQDNSGSYYDTTGTNLKKAFLKAPLRFSRISSGYSGARMHPILKIVRPHLGVDYAAPMGTPVMSIGDGRVISAVIEKGAGRVIRIRHNSVYTTAYLHLSRFEKGISSGAYVKQGQKIGYVGSSGLSTGPHLDFRFYKNGSPVNPLRVEAPSADPISEANRARFEMVKTAVLDLLETIN